MLRTLKRRLRDALTQDAPEGYSEEPRRTMTAWDRVVLWLLSGGCVVFWVLVFRLF